MSLFKIPSPKPRLARNGFDLSSRRIFSAKAGQLLPVGCWEVNPSEHFKISVQDIVRTSNLNTAAYARMKEYYHFFFVSYKSLWQWFDQFIVGTPNAVSALNGVKKNGATDYSALCNSTPMFDLNALLKHFKSSAMSTTYDSQAFDYKKGAYKLLNLLNYGVTESGKLYDYMSFYNNSNNTAANFLSSADLKGSVMVSPFRLLAYQKIFNDFYRNQDWTAPDVRSFNVDDFADNSNLVIADNIAKSFCQMRYRPYPKDWLTGMKPTPNYDKGIFNLPDYVKGAAAMSVNRDSGSTYLAMPNTSSVTTLSVNDLRAAFALDKMLEATRRANGLDYSSQIEAHFGFKVPESRANDARFLGGFDNSIAISEVVSTADFNGTGGKSLGDLAGKGLGSLNSGSISFDAKEHGLIMCIYSAAPQVEYNASYLDPFNKKFKREDFFQPEFADLGYQPILTSDLLFTTVDPSKQPTTRGQHSDTAISMTSANEHNNLLLGWQVRYNEYKTARDVVFGDFESSGSLRYWCTPRFDLRFDGRMSLQSDISKGYHASGLASSQFYINPNVVNPIFLVSAMNADHFYINSYFDVKAVRPMSVHGLASL